MTRQARSRAERWCGLAAVALLVVALPGPAGAKRGAYRETKHGGGGGKALRCSACHLQLGASSRAARPATRFVPGDDGICFSCHAGAGAAGSYQGDATYRQSIHATSQDVVWPGPVPPARDRNRAGQCSNCHDPHGAKDERGLVPSMVSRRGEGLCLECHDGSPARADIRSAVTRSYAHPVSLDGRHDPDERGKPTTYAAGNANRRHAECVDCHNPHVAPRTTFPSTAPDASPRLRGVGRVAVTNGAPGTVPTYRYIESTDTTPAREYEICFKCHSSWTTQPLGQSDLAVLLNPANPSFHPVEAPGRNPSIAPGAFTNGWSTFRMTYCSDCHSSDVGGPRGPHGSYERHILKAPYTVSSSPGLDAMRPTDLCFDCHAYATYADAAAVASWQNSRFNPPGTWAAGTAGGALGGHAFHVGVKRYSCSACHTVHGSPRFPALITTERVPGITGYVQAVAGGTCTTTCHITTPAAVTYTVRAGYER